MTTLSELKSEFFGPRREVGAPRGFYPRLRGEEQSLRQREAHHARSPLALLVGKIGWELIKQTTAEKGLRVDGVGGLTMGADPIALSIGIAAHLQNPENTLRVFNARKEPKKYGLHKNIEGNFSQRDHVVVVDDVVTTGGSTIQAIEKIEADGGSVAFAIVLIDRMEQNGRGNIEARGCPVVSIFDRNDVLSAHAAIPPHSAAALDDLAGDLEQFKKFCSHRYVAARAVGPVSSLASMFHTGAALEFQPRRLGAARSVATQF